MKEATLRLGVLCVCWALAIALVPVVVDCAAPGILGGETKDTTTQTCAGGVVCATWERCPNYSTPTKCEYPDGLPPMQWGARCLAVVLDAGMAHRAAAERCGYGLVTLCASLVDGGCDEDAAR